MILAEHLYSSREQLAIALAQRLSDALRRRDGGVLALSGGSTPKAMLAALAATPTPWDRTTVTLVDDRCVDAEDPRSNRRLLNETLLAPLGPQRQSSSRSTRIASVWPRCRSISLCWGWVRTGTRPRFSLNLQS